MLQDLARRSLARSLSAPDAPPRPASSGHGQYRPADPDDVHRLPQPPARAEHINANGNRAERPKQPVPVARENERGRRGSEALGLHIAPRRPLLGRVLPVNPGAEFECGERLVEAAIGPVQNGQKDHSKKRCEAGDAQEDDIEYREESARLEPRRRRMMIAKTLAHL